jgi:hypothetical protein
LKQKGDKTDMDFNRFICLTFLTLACFIHFGCAKEEEPALATSKESDESQKAEETQGKISGIIEPADVQTSIQVFQNMVEIAKVEVKAEAAGKYSIQLPPGKYDLKISAEGFKDKEITQVEVVAGKSAEVEKVVLKRTAPSPPPPPGALGEGEPQQPPAPALVIGSEVGQIAPGFSLEDINNKKVALSDYKGKKLVLLTFHRGQF